MQPKLLPFTRSGLLLASCLLLIAGCARPPATGVSDETLNPTVRVGQHSFTATVQFEDESQSARTAQVNYLLYLPKSYGQDPQQNWPLILFLHGRGERGDDLDLLKKHPLPKILEDQVDFPAVVVSPQHSLQSVWWSDIIDPLNALLDQLQAEYSIDPLRIYLTGLSMGGFGAWEFALRYPQRFAAVVPIAGGYQEGKRVVPGNICELKDIPIWVFHGGSDSTVPSFHSEILVKALQACGSNVRFTLYAGAEHEESFLRAYAEPELFPWLFAQTQE